MESVHTIGTQRASSAPVIEENVWVGTDAHILKGVRIGRDCVIGAGTVVRRSIPPGKIVIGNPAELVGDIPGAAPTAPS